MEPGRNGREQSPRGLFGDDYADPRTSEQREADSKGVRRQAASLRVSRREEAIRRELTRAVQERRSERSDLLQFDLVRDERGTEVGVVRGALLVRAESAQDPGLLQTVARFGFTARPVEELDGRLVRLTSTDVPSSRLPDIAALLRRSGHQVSVDHVTPLGPIMKGRTGPEPTTGARSHPTLLASPAGVPVQVAVIDTGITTQERSDGWLREVLRDGNVDPLDDLPTGGGDGFLDFGAGHGTFAAGVVAQVSPRTPLAVYRAIDSDGIGSEVDVAVAMLRAVADGAAVLSLSLGGQTLEDQPLLAVEVALDLLEERSPDVLVVAAAGNEGSTRPVWPAASKRVVAVAGLDAALQPTAWSSSGFWVDCSTIGEGVLSTFVSGRESPELDPDPDVWAEDAWAVWTGTSFAAPQVAGAVARIASETPCTPRQALRLLLASGRSLPDHGRAVRILPGT